MKVFWYRVWDACSPTSILVICCSVSTICCTCLLFTVGFLTIDFILCLIIFTMHFLESRRLNYVCVEVFSDWAVNLLSSLLYLVVCSFKHLRVDFRIFLLTGLEQLYFENMEPSLKLITELAIKQTSTDTKKWSNPLCLIRSPQIKVRI